MNSTQARVLFSNVSFYVVFFLLYVFIFFFFKYQNEYNERIFWKQRNPNPSNRMFIFCSFSLLFRKFQILLKCYLLLLFPKKKKKTQKENQLNLSRHFLCNVWECIVSVKSTCNSLWRRYSWRNLRKMRNFWIKIVIWLTLFLKSHFIYLNFGESAFFWLTGFINW